MPSTPVGNVTATAPATERLVITQKSVAATVTGVLVAVRTGKFVPVEDCPLELKTAQPPSVVEYCTRT